MADFGGEMLFSYGGTPLKLRAKFESEPSNLEFEGGANQDNSTFRTAKPTGWLAEPTFSDELPAGITWDQIIRGGPYNMTLNEEFTGRLHVWTSAKFEGKIRRNHMDG